MVSGVRKTTILSNADLGAIALPDDRIRKEVEAGLVMLAQGDALAAPTTVFNPLPGQEELIAVVQGALPLQKLALVKTVGGFPGNAARGLATNPGCLMVIETDTGQVVGILPASTITTQRTAMVSAIGALRLANPNVKVMGSIGTGAISLQTIRYIARQNPLSEIRLYGRNSTRAKAAAEALSQELGTPVIATSNWSACLQEADILIEGAALPADDPLFPMDAVKPGAVVIAYGAYSSFPADVMSRMDRLVLDRWEADGLGPLGPQATSGQVDETTHNALIGDVIAGRARPREAKTDRILFCHRGIAACDLMLASAILPAARAKGIGTEIQF